MPRTLIARAGLAAHVVALACIVVAIVKRNQGSVEGAYFNRSVGGGDGDGFIVTTVDLTPWLVAAAVLLVLGTAALVAAARRSSG